MDTKQSISLFLGKARQSIILNYIKKNAQASNQYANAIEPFQNETLQGYRFGLLGAYYSKWIEEGRGKNTNQTKDGLRRFVNWAGSSFIKQWLKDKGLDDKYSYAIAYKIARQGYKGKYIVRDSLQDLQPDLTQLAKDVTKNMLENISTQIVTKYKK